MDHPGDVTDLLHRLGAGDPMAESDLLPLVYEALRDLAGSHLRRERRDHTLQATDLLHEAYLKLADQTRVDWKNRGHFLAVAAQAMRRILVDHARQRNSQKRGGQRGRVDLDTALLVGDDPGTDLVALDEALVRLATEHPEKARVVELRFFGGLTNAEAAEVVGATTRTVERHWTFARAWMYRALAPDVTEPRSDADR